MRITVGNRAIDRGAAVLLLGTLLLFGAACQKNCPTTGTTGGTGTAAAGAHTVPLQIMSGSGGAVLAFVEVSIDNQGPFRFALDTGASNSVIDTRVAQQLNLPTTPAVGQVTGVASSERAQLARVDQWQVGDVQLPPANVVVLDLAQGSSGISFAGLLGSDMLSRYGSVLVDYDGKHLVLSPHR